MLTGGFQNTATAEQLFYPLKTPQKAAAAAVENKKQPAKTEEFPQIQMVDVTTVSIRPEEVEAPKLLNFFGYKIDLTSKIADLKDSYVKNYGQTKSHNLMVARFAEFKTAALGALLAVLGVPSDEIENMQKKAVRDAVKQNKLLFEENEYNAELLSLIGGGKKRMRAQNRVISDIRSQLAIQAVNLRMEPYSKEKVLEIKLAQCRKILEKFLEEKNSLDYQYQLVAFGVN